MGDTGLEPVAPSLSTQPATLAKKPRSACRLARYSDSGTIASHRKQAQTIAKNRGTRGLKRYVPFYAGEPKNGVSMFTGGPALLFSGCPSATRSQPDAMSNPCAEKPVKR